VNQETKSRTRSQTTWARRTSLISSTRCRENQVKSRVLTEAWHRALTIHRELLDVKTCTMRDLLTSMHQSLKRSHWVCSNESRRSITADPAPRSSDRRPLCTYVERATPVGKEEVKLGVRAPDWQRLCWDLRLLKIGRTRHCEVGTRPPTWRKRGLLARAYGHCPKRPSP